MFNKKFEDKYPNVRKPLICNGLKEITPYQSHHIPPKVVVEEDKEEEVVEESIEVNIE